MKIYIFPPVQSNENAEKWISYKQILSLYQNPGESSPSTVSETY